MPALFFILFDATLKNPPPPRLATGSVTAPKRHTENWGGPIWVR